VTCLLTALCASSLCAQPRAILTDGAGPWIDAQWPFTVAQFSGLLSDAGYSVTIVSPANLSSALNSPDILVAVPSLESLPFDAFTAIAAHVNAGGSLMASGGEPFRDALYLAPNGQWLDSAAYLQAVGSPPPQGPFTPPYIPTVSPSQEQYTASSGIRIPVPRGRGLFSSTFSSGRYSVIGDLSAPSATIYVNQTFSFSPSQTLSGAQSFVVWLPWPQISDPLRAQLISALQAAPNRLFFTNAGADQVVWLPGEAITGSASIQNGAAIPVQATLQWSITGPSGVTQQPAIDLALAADELRQVPWNIGSLPNGDYTLNFRLMIGSQQVDRIDSPLRVLDPTLSRQPDQKIHVVNGAFVANVQHVFLRGVNYWPRFVAGMLPGDFNGQSWLEAGQYDPDVVEADLTEIAALHFNLVNIQYSDYEGFWVQEGRSLIDFLERCRSHGIWVQIALRTTLTNAAYAGQASPTVESYLQAAYLPGNDRVLAYELLWEPMVGTHDMGGQGRIVNGAIVYNTGRMVLDPDWRTWVNDQYGSLATAQQAWGFTAPVDVSGQLTNPLDDQIENDGAWRIMVAAYRRFLDDYLGRNLGAIARRLRRSDPDTLLTYRNWTTMGMVDNEQTGYDIGSGAAHLDYFSPERYSPLLWPDSRASGLVTSYSRYRTGGKPVVWAEYGADIGANGGTPASQAAAAAVCDTMMRDVMDDGSNGASVWWWPGGYSPLDGTDFGIVDPGGNPRPCANTLAQWNATFAATPPDLMSDPATTLTVDRDADARGSYGLFLNNQNLYVQARQAGQSVVLADQGTGTDTSTMPMIQVGNVPYAGSGPLKFANAEFAGLHIVCPSMDVTVENGSSLTIPPGAVCQVTPTLVNTGEAQWLPGVILHTNIGDLPLAASLPSLQRAAIGPFSFTMGQSTLVLSGRMRIVGGGDFGEVLNLTLGSTASGSCTISLNPSAAISAPSSGATGTIQITAPSGCTWPVSSDQPWMSVSPAAGSGNGTVTYIVQSDYGPQRQATISIGNDALTITQNGVSNSSSAQAPALSTTSVNFGSRAIGSSGSAQPVQLTNTDTTALHLLSISVGGLSDADFAETNNCGTTLAPGDGCTIQVSFVPMAVGIRTASLYIAGNINAGTSAVSLSGTGVATGPVPTIQAIVDSWGYTAGIAPGLWVTIGDTNLAGPPQTWNLDGVQELPLALGDTMVTFNGVPAALLYVSATQINALVPASVAAGAVQVVAQVNGVNSNSFTITAQPVHPAVYAPPTADGSSFFVTAALAGTATLVGNGATDPRVVRPVYPGDTLDLYMIGLGATLDPSKFITDQVFAGAFPLSASVTASVGGEPANVIFAGLTSPGLYLVRIVVPSDLSAGAQALQVSAGGIQPRPSLILQMAAAP